MQLIKKDVIKDVISNKRCNKDVIKYAINKKRCDKRCN